MQTIPTLIETDSPDKELEEDKKNLRLLTQQILGQHLKKKHVSNIRREAANNLAQSVTFSTIDKDTNKKIPVKKQYPLAVDRQNQRATASSFEELPSLSLNNNAAE